MLFLILLPPHMIRSLAGATTPGKAVQFLMELNRNPINVTANDDDEDVASIP